MNFKRKKNISLLFEYKMNNNKIYIVIAGSILVIIGLIFFVYHMFRYFQIIELINELAKVFGNDLTEIITEIILEVSLGFALIITGFMMLILYIILERRAIPTTVPPTTVATDTLGFCPNCGAKIVSKKDGFCTQCGKKINF